MKCGICNRDGLTEKELSVHTKYFHGKSAHEQPQKVIAGACPECGSTLWYQEGCANCLNCGYNRCG